MKFADRLKELRKEKDVSQKKLAEFLKVDSTAVRNWETRGGETNYDMLIKISNYFGVTVDYLIGKTNDY